MSDEDASVLICLSAAYVILKNRQRKRRSKWMTKYLKQRNNVLLRELQEEEAPLFKNFTRMSRANFDRLLQIIEPDITTQDTNFREAIPANVKLLITLRYLATGDSFSSLMYLFRVSKQFISKMLPQVLRAIVKRLRHYVTVSRLLLIKSI